MNPSTPLKNPKTNNRLKKPKTHQKKKNTPQNPPKNTTKTIALKLPCFYDIFQTFNASICLKSYFYILQLYLLCFPYVKLDLSMTYSNYGTTKPIYSLYSQSCFCNSTNCSIRVLRINILKVFLSYSFQRLTFSLF